VLLHLAQHRLEMAPLPVDAPALGAAVKLLEVLFDVRRNLPLSASALSSTRSALHSRHPGERSKTRRELQHGEDLDNLLGGFI